MSTNSCCNHLSTRMLPHPTAPHTEVNSKGDIVHSQVLRENVRKLEAYVEEMASSDTVSEISEEQKNHIKALYEDVVRSLRKGPDPCPSRVWSHHASSQFIRPQVSGISSLSADKVPLLHLKRNMGTAWEYSSNLTSIYLDILQEIATAGMTFKDKNALLTGVGKGSIGAEIIKGLLAGSAHVVITTSQYNRAAVEYYQSIFHSCGSRGSALTVVPFNQGSMQDVEALVDYIYANLGLDLDFILPFTGIPENGRETDGIDDKSELAHRIMLTNLLRIMGAVKNKKASHRFVIRPTQVIFSLSPNHGLFGNVGLYSESKISLETLFQRWTSESWGEYLCLTAAVIGWTRGTGLMGPMNMVGHELESYGVCTFSAKEMAFNILGRANLGRIEWWYGPDRPPDLAEITGRIRTNLNKKSDLHWAIARDNAADYKVINGAEADCFIQTVDVLPHADFSFDVPALESVESFGDVSKLRGTIDFDRVIIIAGSAEVGPSGGEFMIEGAMEMAWMMGFIKHFDGRLKDGTLYVGWFDSKSGDPAGDKDIKVCYEKDVLAHTDVHLIEPELLRGYDPKKKTLEVTEAEAQKFKLQHGDKCDIWARESGQRFFKLKKGACVFVPKAFTFSQTVAGQVPTGCFGIPEDIIAQVDRYMLWSLACAAEVFNMSGIIDPYKLYKYIHPSDVGTCFGAGLGCPDSMCKMFKDHWDEKEVQNDILQETYSLTPPPVGSACFLYHTVVQLRSPLALVPLLSMKKGHTSFANIKATSNADTSFAMGREPVEMSCPATSTRSGFMEAQGTGIHIVMSAKTALELGCPIRGIGAFASTSTRTICSSSRARRTHYSKGSTIKTSSPLCSISTIAIVNLCSITRRSPNGLPTNKSSWEKKSSNIWRSHRALAWPLFKEERISDLEIFERYTNNVLTQIQQRQCEGYHVDIQDAASIWKVCQFDIYAVPIPTQCGHESSLPVDTHTFTTWNTLLSPFLSTRYLSVFRLLGPLPVPLSIALGYRRAEIGSLSRSAWCTASKKDALVCRSYLLARILEYMMMYAITVDTFHTWNKKYGYIIHIPLYSTNQSLRRNPNTLNTKANEENETHIWTTALQNLGHTAGNAVPIMAQKSFLGHAKGCAAAWQMSSVLDTINPGIVLGNGNSDNIDSRFMHRTCLMFPSKSIQTDGVHAGVMSSFGFGQVDGTALVVHPRYLFGALDPDVRQLETYNVMSEMIIKNNLVKIKEKPPYTLELEDKVLTNSLARLSADPQTGPYSFSEKQPMHAPIDDSNIKAVTQLLEARVTLLASVSIKNSSLPVPCTIPPFVSCNFTDTEIAYCNAQPSPSSSFAARWVGKKAVFESLGVQSKDAAAAMKDVKIVNEKTTDIKLLKKHIISLRVHLRNASMAWVEEFLSEEKGLDSLTVMLVGLVGKGGKRKNLTEIETNCLLEIVKCFKVFLNAGNDTK
ncbi:hypothetical protein IW261DRAFT_1678031 [Armillaria novae-zelandiae]|uniref:Fatty acid synthase type I helical domain-containing protein n=1 Tax=Armillaria novae-zelandiae TaxID=153914 RepID=A0AA39PDP0_9AGAR|nr:hypothetical protein IW261DRAFT_1678031 [Armillaria novae-zelandiae]